MGLTDQLWLQVHADREYFASHAPAWKADGRPVYVIGPTEKTVEASPPPLPSS